MPIPMTRRETTELSPDLSGGGERPRGPSGCPVGGPGGKHVVKKGPPQSSVMRKGSDEKYVALCQRYKAQGLEDWNERAYTEAFDSKCGVLRKGNHGQRKGTRREPLPPRHPIRFTYWHQLLFAPIPPAEWEAHRVLLNDARQLSKQIAQEFARHLAGSCRERGCPWDVVLKGSTTNQRPNTLLRHYIRVDRLWWRNKEAWEILRSLPTKAQTALLRVHYQQSRQCRRKWQTTLDAIERDQKVFHAVIEERASGQSIEDALAKVAIHFNISDRTARQIYVAYRYQALLLLGEQTPLDQLARQRSIPREAIKRLQRMRSDAARVSLPFTLSVPSPICRNWDDVFAWFALALQNMRRYRNGHAPLPRRHLP